METVTLNNSEFKNIPRCPICYLIYSFELEYENGVPLLIYKCINNHNGKISLKNFIIDYNKKNLIKKEQIINKTNLFNHHSLFYKDSICKTHSNLLNSYCLFCEENLCIKCEENHKTHKIINLLEFNFYD